MNKSILNTLPMELYSVCDHVPDAKLADRYTSVEYSGIAMDVLFGLNVL